MHANSKQISDKTLCTLPLPGSHDAGSYGAIRTRSRTQQISVLEQLNAGVRFFDFRVIVDGQVYFSHHGGDHSRDNPYIDANTQHQTLLAQIKTFCDSHTGEVVILCFNDFWHFKGKDLVADNASDKEKLTFVAGLKAIFGTPLLVSRNPTISQSHPLGAIPTYQACINSGQRILVIFDDNDTWQDDVIWKKKDFVDDHFSNKNTATARTWEKLGELTIIDQEAYLKSGNRKIDRFCVTQAVLDYNNGLGTTTDNKKKIENSRNYAGAERINPMFVDAYRRWWAGISAASNKPLASVRKPNILLMDFSGEFDDFPTVCESLVNLK